MSADHRAYLDTSALAKWYLNEAGSEAFVAFLQGLGAAVISSLTVTEMRCLLSRRRRMGDLSVELESARYPEHPLRTLDALHLTLAVQAGVSVLATADGVMASAATSMGLDVVRF